MAALVEEVQVPTPRAFTAETCWYGGGLPLQIMEIDQLQQGSCASFFFLCAIFARFY